MKKEPEKMKTSDPSLVDKIFEWVARVFADAAGGKYVPKNTYRGEQPPNYHQESSLPQTFIPPALEPSGLTGEQQKRLDTYMAQVHYERLIDDPQVLEQKVYGIRISAKFAPSNGNGGYRGKDDEGNRYAVCWPILNTFLKLPLINSRIEETIKNAIAQLDMLDRNNGAQIQFYDGSGYANAVTIAQTLREAGEVRPYDMTGKLDVNAKKDALLAVYSTNFGINRAFN